MASIIFASSPLSVQSFVKLRTNSNYSHSPCYVSMAKTSYTHLSFKNISNIQSSKSLFTKGDGSFYFSSTKLPSVASKYSPSLNIIKAISERENIYHFSAHDKKTGRNISLNERYKGQILLIVNLPQKISNDKEIREMQFLNGLRNRYRDKQSDYGKGFEILGFRPDMKQSIREKVQQFFHLSSEKEEEEIHIPADFPIFVKGRSNDSNDRDFWNFLRKRKEEKNQKEEEKEFEKYLVDGEGKCIENFPWFEGEQLKGTDSEDVIPGMSPGPNVPRPPGLEEDPRYSLENAIAEYFKRDYTN